MSGSEFKRISPWVPTLIVLGVVLAAGARLITLSVQEHTTRAREAAQKVVGSQARLIRAQLQELALTAQAVAPRETSAGPRGLASVIRVDGDGRVIQASNAERTVAQGIADELVASGVTRSPSNSLVGPIRQGSQWIIGVRVPVETQPTAAALATDAGSVRPGSTIAYRSLDELLARAQLGNLASEGYDFELSQIDPATGRPRIFMNSKTTPLEEAVRQMILPPVTVAPSSAGDWMIAILPHGGWYPAGRFAGEIGLLGLIAWVLALFVFDAKRDSRRLQGALSHSRRRLDEANDRLVTEIEERLTLQKSLEHARYHDAFTGLPNRRYFMDQLDRALRDVRVRHGQRFAVALVELDRFKLITDTLGHPAGDEVMVQASRRFERAMATIESVLARWDGQRFAVLLFNVHSRDTALSIATLLQESMREPFDLRGHRLSVSAGMGVTHVESGLQRAEDVVREADIALSVVKTREGAKVLAYDGSMGGEVVSMVSLEADLHIALARDELRLLHQPIVELGTGRIVGAETLLRWEHPVEGMLAPDKFLMIAEDTGLIVPITRWIIRRACSLVAEARRRLPGDSEFYLSVNLSAAAMRDPGLRDFVTEALGATALPAPAIKFELTEAALISNPGAAREALARLSQLGVQLMLDDFGTGYSSLSHLQLFPFDYVKIDRPFVGQAADSAQRGVTSAMVQMASSLGLSAIAERVESEQAVPALQAMGCRYAQGYFFSAPIDAEELLRRLRGESAVADVPLEEDDSPTLVVPVLTTTSEEQSEWGQPIESVVIAAAPEGSRPPQAEPPVLRDEVPASALQEAEPRRRSPNDPPTQPLAESPRVVAAQLAKTTGLSDRSPRRQAAQDEESPDEEEDRQEESLAARIKRRLRPGQAR